MTRFARFLGAHVMGPKPRPRYLLAITLTLLIAAGVLWDMVARVSSAHSVQQAILTLIGGLVAAAGFVAYALYLAVQAWRHRGERDYERSARDRAITGRDASTLLAAPHDQPRLPAHRPAQEEMPLPLVIRLRPNWWRVLATAGLSTFAIAIFVACLTLLTDPSLPDALVYPLVTQLVFAPTFLLLTLNEARQTLEVSQHTLMVMGSWQPSRQTIHFSDAQLFALCPPGRRGEPPLCYELATPRATVRWLRVRRHMPFMPGLLISNTRPTMPLDQYEAHMEWLLAYVAEQTRLPLYDLRQP
jgi:hypothetical protein